MFLRRQSSWPRKERHVDGDLLTRWAVFDAEVGKVGRLQLVSKELEVL